LFAINESFNAATVKREREDVPEYQRLPTCLKLFFKEIWVTMKTSRFDLWELEKVQQIEDENLSTCQMWTTFILLANICA
jgi:hypothetical protein